MTAPTDPIASWEVHLGLSCSHIGEDGDMVIAGHPDERRAVVALNRFQKGYTGDPLADTYAEAANALKRRWAHWVTGCDDMDVDVPGHRADCYRCAEIAESAWWMDYGATEPAPGLFPVTVWRP